MNIKNFVALDFEYLPNTQEIIQIGYTVVANGKIRETRCQYIKPQCSQSDYDKQNYLIWLTGITYDMLCDAPTFKDIAHNLHNIINNNNIVVHNARSAELCVLTKELERLNVPRIDGQWPTFNCYCTLEISRIIKSKIGVNRCGLNEMCEYFNIPLEHHNAGSDAEATAKLFIEITKRFDLNDYTPIIYNSSYSVGKSKIVKIDNITKKNKFNLTDIQEHLESPISNITAFSEDVIVLTGFSQSDKEYIMERLNSIGAIIKQNITNDTTCIIAGENAGWSKLEKASKRGIPVINIKDIII